jgi:predicted O-linked N-acetylglucosamine transferase (SPINDLY family)
MSGDENDIPLRRPHDGQVQAEFTRAMALFQSGNVAESEPHFRNILQREPKNHIALHMLGVISLQTGRTELGADLIEQSIAQFADDPFAHRNLGYAYSLLDRPEQALASYDKALALKPDFANVHYNRGVALEMLERHDEALNSYDRAIRLDAAYAEAHNNRANTLNRLHRHTESLVGSNTAIALKPDYAEAHNNRGNAFVALRRFAESLKSFDRAIAINPDFGAAYGNRANALHELKRYEDALLSIDRAMALCPLYASAGAADARDPGLLLGHRLHTKLAICDWTDLAGQVAELAERVNRGQSVTPPFPLLLASGSADVQRRAAEIYARSGSSIAVPTIAKHAPRSKIRLGYFSADFYEHATAYLMAELFERHDRTRFELTAFSFGPQTGDEMYQRLTRAFDSFVEVRGRSDGQIAGLARELEIDIAIDLKGYTAGSRPDIFAHRAAPVQVNYLGYPGTMGADFVDYLIADPTLIPIDCRRFYSEKIVYLPDTYQPNDTKRHIADRQLTRAEAGLPEEGFVFCCFNNSFKIVPETFDSWMRILKQVEGSVLWLIDDNSSAAANLKKEAASRGVHQERLVFAKRIATPEHLARHRLADLFLDTLPYNAHTTASDALWTGLPVLTLAGETFAGRVAASLLTALGLPELITATAGEYESLAVALASAPSRLAALRHKLAANRLSKPLFDIARYTRHIEAAYSQMIERYQADLSPEHIFVAGEMQG